MKYSFIRFLTVGVVNTLVGLSIMFFLLHFVHLSYWISTFLGNAVGAIVSFTLNRSYTFKINSPMPKSFFKFVLVVIICYVISYQLGKILIDLSIKNISLTPKIETDLAVIFSTGLYTIINYFCQKHFVFSIKENSPTSNRI